MSPLRVLLPAAAAALLGFSLYAGYALLSCHLDRPGMRDVDPAGETWRAERLAAEGAALKESLRRGDEIRRELIAGRLTLRQAVAALAKENALRPPAVRAQPYLRRAATEEECWCLVVIGSVESMLWLDPSRDAVVARLRAEYEAIRAAREGRPSAVASSTTPGG
jgi:hypothetical protein